MTQTLQEAVAQTLKEIMTSGPLTDPYEILAQAAISTTLKWAEENVSEEMIIAGEDILDARVYAGDLETLEYPLSAVQFKAMISAMRKGMEDG